MAFSGLVEPKFISMLAKMLKTARLPRNTLLVKRGDIGSEMWFIISGAAGKARHSPRGQIPIPSHSDWLCIMAEALLELDGVAVGKLGPGSFFGEAALLSDAPRNAYVRSLTDMEVFVLKKTDLMLALDAFPSLRDVVLQSMDARIASNATRDQDYQPSWTARKPLKRHSVLDEPTKSPHRCTQSQTLCSMLSFLFCWLDKLSLLTFRVAR